MLSNTINKFATQQADLTLRLVPGIITLGRAKDNKIKISEERVSKYHARIFTYFQASYIEDLESTNGTFVNGKRIGTHILHPGDEVMLGKYRIQIETH
ncbi:MAG: FHA domain-containing protein [Gammaproteobacteria bacterium]